MITFTYKDNILYITASGHVRANDCGPIKNFSTKQLTDSDAIKEVYLEMKDCSYMDSTFIGIVAGINKQLRKKWKKSVQIQNIQKSCMDLFDAMSLSSLLIFLTEPVLFPAEENNQTDSMLISNIDIAEAHEELIELSEENKKKFGLLAKILREK